MTREEYFNIAVGQLSVRAQWVVSDLQITADNISYLSLADIKSLRNCGKKTEEELLSFVNKIKTHYPPDIAQDEQHSIDSSSEFFRTLQLDRELSPRAISALVSLNIRDFKTFDEYIRYKRCDFLKLRNFGKGTLTELEEFYEYALNKHLQKVSYNTRQEYRQYKELYSSFLDNKCFEIYETLISNCASVDRKYIKEYLPDYRTLLLTEIKFLRIKKVTDFQQKNIKDMLKRFCDRFYNEMDVFLTTSKDELLLQSFFERVGCLRLESQDFIRQFKETNLHLPYFYIIYIALKSEKIFKNRSSKLYNASMGLYGEEKDYSDLAEDTHLSRERVRQILRNLGGEFNTFIESIFGDKIEIINTYPFLKYDFITSTNTHFEEFAAKEQLPISFNMFCSICTMLNNELEMLHFYETSTGQLRPKSERLKRVYSTAYNTKLSVCNIMQLMQKLQEAILKPQDNVISISEFCRNPKFWNGPLNEDILPRVVQFIEQLAGDLLEIEVDNGKIHLETKKLDIEQTLYDILTQSEAPITFQEICEEVCKKIPDDVHISITQIRRKLIQSKRIIAIKGKALYTTIEHADCQLFKGSLSECVISVISEAEAPIKREQLLKKVLELRRDSNVRSVNAIISSLLRSNQLLLLNKIYIGLSGRTYGTKYVRTDYDGHNSFGGRIEEFANFVSENQRFPFLNGHEEEASLARWYNRILKDYTLTTQQLVALHNLQQRIPDNIPQTVDQLNCRQNCERYKTYIMRTGSLVTHAQDEALYGWFKRTCQHYSSINDVRKVYFDELISVIQAFGYQVELK